ncbi:hypothetical protein ACTPOE_03990 [Castellaniella sp. WN]
MRIKKSSRAPARIDGGISLVESSLERDCSADFAKSAEEIVLIDGSLPVNLAEGFGVEASIQRTPV